MEFGFRTGDRGRDRSTLPVPTSECPGSSAAGGPFHGEPPPSSRFEWEAAARRERILREELEVERRLVQELSRRELALRGGFGPVPFPSLGGFVPPPPPPPGPFFGPDGALTPPMPLPLTPVVGVHPNWPPPAALFGPWAGFGCPQPLAGFGQPVMLDETRTTHLPPPEPTHQIQPGEHYPSEALPLETKVSGAKRKTDVSSATTEPTKLQSASSAATEPIKLQNADWSCAFCQLIATSEADLSQHLEGKKHKAKLVQCATTKSIKLQNARRDWSCALCQVSATCEADLNQHLEGKKHKAKLVQCGAIKVTDTNKSGLQVTAGNNNGVCPSDAHKEIHILFEVDGEIHQVVRNSNYVCERCGVSCANAAAMADHLRGKKHSLLKGARMNKEVKESSAATCERKINEDSPTGISVEHREEDTSMTSQFNGDGSFEIPMKVKETTDTAEDIDTRNVIPVETNKKDTEAVRKVNRNCETEQEGTGTNVDVAVHKKSRKKANKKFLLKVHQKSRKKANKKLLLKRKKAKKGVRRFGK